MTVSAYTDADAVAEDVGIALSCLQGGMIPLDRFKACLMGIIERADVDDLPPCVFDMLDVGDRFDLQREVDIPKAIRFPRFLTDRRIDALIGLHLEQNPDRENLSNIPTARARAALAACPEVRERFDALFGGQT